MRKHKGKVSKMVILCGKVKVFNSMIRACKLKKREKNRLIRINK